MKARGLAAGRPPPDLKTLSIRVLVTLGTVFIGACLWLAFNMFTLLQVAEHNGARAAPALMASVRAVANVERLVLLGEQLVSAPQREGWQGAGRAMQALAHHPSLAALDDPQRQVQETFWLAEELLRLRETGADPLAVLDRWAGHRLALERIADKTASELAGRTTHLAETAAAAARRMLILTLACTLTLLVCLVALVRIFQLQLVAPLLAVSRRLAAMRSGLIAEEALPRARNREMAEVFEALEALEKAQDSLRDKSLRDPLTGLPNRYALEMQLSQALSSARRQEIRLALLFVDLDNFKSVNDSLGHPVGDRLLLETASRMTHCLGDSGSLARLGGDEFVVLLDGLGEPQQIAAIADRLIAAVGQPLQVEHHRIVVSASIGASLFPDDALDTATLMKHADIAMYHAKAAGKANCQFYSDELNQQILERIRLEGELREAVARQAFVLHFQPQMQIGGARVHGVEALLRWPRSEGAPVGPDRFIPIAEETGLIVPLGQWVLRTACQTLAQWRRHGLDDIIMAVNLSALQLNDTELPKTVARILAQTGVPADRLELEVTESVAMKNPQLTIANLRALRELGCSLSIDDFGTGYSSLAYLKLFPISRIKLDRAFVKDIEVDPNDAAICAATIRLAHSLSLEVVAEGVETAAQHLYLQELGCNLVQGYFFSRPLPMLEAEHFVLRHRPQDEAQGLRTPDRLAAS